MNGWMRLRRIRRVEAKVGTTFVWIRAANTLTGLPTSMISLCQEGKSFPDALGRSANKSLQVSPARLRASRRWFLFDREPDIHLLSLPRRASQKIELVISCQSRNNSMGASGAYAPSLSRLLTRPDRLRAEEILLYFAHATQRCGFLFLL